ncbi:MAG: peroxiredoxin [Candidatus Heimdallarchaeota archaeon]
MNTSQNFNSIPLIGNKFPEMEVITSQGKKKLPKDFRRQWVIFFSHTADFTPVCTTEIVSFAKKYEEFQNLGCELFGLSMDQVYCHIKWIEWINEKFDVKIPFPIVADNGSIAKKLGIIHFIQGLNKVRAVFIVDPNGIIRLVMFYPQEIGRNVNELIRIVKSLKIVDKENVIIPADWPKNELIGQQVIINPPTDELTAKQRSKEYRCYDWWFCYKSLEFD